MKHINSSPERNTFQAQSSKKKLMEDPSEANAKAMVDFWDTLKIDYANKIEDPEWQKNNMEYDLRSSVWMCDKAKATKVYAQNLYAALCNNEFQQLDAWSILQDTRWSCSWRHAGGIVADMLEVGDYIDWYLSGLNSVMSESEIENLTDQQLEDYNICRQYVGEGHITEEIIEDLKILGWTLIEYHDII